MYGLFGGFYIVRTTETLEEEKFELIKKKSSVTDKLAWAESACGFYKAQGKKDHKA